MTGITKETLLQMKAVHLFYISLETNGSELSYLCCAVIVTDVDFKVKTLLSIRVLQYKWFHNHWCLGIKRRFSYHREIIRKKVKSILSLWNELIGHIPFWYHETNMFTWYRPLLSRPTQQTIDIGTLDGRGMMNHCTCVTHVPWCMSGSLTHGFEENVPGIRSACATRNFTYLVRDPLT